MKIIANCHGMRLEIPVGSGKQHVRWLGLVVAMRVQREKYPYAFRVPQRVLSSEGLLPPRAVLCEVLQDGEEVTVELRQGAHVQQDMNEFDEEDWIEQAYGADSNLRECKFRWKVDPKHRGDDVPKMVRGDFVVSGKWLSVYPQEDYGGPFEIPIEPVEVHGGDGNGVDWVASRKGPPGTCTFKFVMTDGSEIICKYSPETLEPDGQYHMVEFPWDVPIAPEPYPEIDSRPSTASSRDGAQVDPRFELDWEAMRLRWVEPFMKVRLKDVLTEFYAILIDLFDSYAFMGLDLANSQYTIGMDDWRHLMLNCGVLEGQPEGFVQWSLYCSWYAEAADIKDGFPYLAQRLTRAHYLELLLRTAFVCSCEGGAKPPGATQQQPMPLDEGLFRFITDTLIPVMDVYDDDPIRKDAVQHQNLIVIQQSRPSIRSVYSLLSRPWPFSEEEQLVGPGALRFVLEFACQKLKDEEGGGAKKEEGEEVTEDGEAAPAAGAKFSGEDKLDAGQLELVLETFDDIWQELTDKHPGPPEQRAFLFWEFFEVLMQCCRRLQDNGYPLAETIPAFVQTCLVVTGLVEAGEVQLPSPPEQSEMEAEAEA